jgi:hypothetical protein
VRIKAMTTQTPMILRDIPIGIDATGQRDR